MNDAAPTPQRALPSRRFSLIAAVALKELRQSVRSKLVVVGLLFYLAALSIAATICLLVSQKMSLDLDSPAGLPLAITSGVIFAFVAFNAIPALTAGRALSEFDPSRRDISLTTSLAPSDIVDGKTIAAFCLTLLLAAATLPFLVLAFLLGGIPPGIMLLILAFMLVGSIPMTSFALVVAAAPFNRVIRILLLVGWFLQGGLSILATISSITFAHGGPFLPDHIPIVAIAGVVASSAGAFLLCRAITAFLFTPPHLDRGRPLLHTIAAIWALSVLAACFPPTWEKFFAWATASIIFFACFLPFVTAGRPGYSRRGTAQAPASPIPRFFSFLFSTNSDSALLLLVLLAAASAAVAFVCQPRVLLSNAACPFVFALYSFDYFVTFRLLWLLAFRNSRVSPRLAPAAALVAIAIATAIASSIAAVNEVKFNEIPFVPFAALSPGAIDIHIFAAGIWFLVIAAPFLFVLLRTFRAYRAPVPTA